MLLRGPVDLQRSTDWLRFGFGLPMRNEARVGHPSPAAPSCRRADATALESLPERIGELRSLKHLCVAARRMHLIAPCHGAAQVHRPVQPNEAPRFDLQPQYLKPVRAAFRCPLHSESNLCGARAPQGRVEQCPQGATEVRVQHGQPDVAVRADRNLEACAAAPSARCCCRNAEKQRDELQALPDLASSRTLLYVCVPPLRSAVGHVPLRRAGVFVAGS